MTEETVTHGRTTDEPIAVVGVSCRLPGAPTPAEFWQLLTEGRAAIRDTPADRRGAPVRGGFLDTVGEFDAGFFAISPREAATLDPQQRLLLELAWEAFEAAGILPMAARGAPYGVFVGAMADDYATLAHQAGPSAITPYTLTGLNRGLLANRVSYTLGLRGPSISVDTAQSSSLVAVHLAVESLHAGECDAALVAGVNLMLAADSTIAAERFGGLSPDGRCATFDAAANGYVRGEGGVAMLLKPLRTALADGDEVLCVVRGSAVNNDGATDGLTVPSPDAQREVLLTACRRAGVAPLDVQYVELHGTGTALGDPIEAAALGAAYGPDRPTDVPLLVGSAKTNVGHLEGAAGIVGLLKTVLGLHRRHIPASLNLVAPNPDIPFDDLRLSVVTRLSPWPRPDRPLLAGVSSFGMGGTNCHVVLGEAPPAEHPRRELSTGEPPAPWLLSGRTEAALRDQAARLRTAVGVSAHRTLDVAYSSARTRTPFEHRAAVLGRDEDRLAALDALARNEPAAGLVRGKARPGVTLAFLFTGQGSQRAGMGRELHVCHPAYTHAFDEVCAELDRHLTLDRPLREVVLAGAGALVDRTDVTQPALFAMETALYRLLGSWGVRPDVVLGHSVGEITAAHVAGVLDLPDAAALVAARGRLMAALPAGGAMVAVAAAEEEVLPLLADRTDLAVAAVNGPRSIVLSGAVEAVTELAAVLAARGCRTRRLRVGHAFHSPLLDPMLDAFYEVADGLGYRMPTIPVVSNVVGRIATPEELADPRHWTRHVREPVRFLAGARATLNTGVRAFLEVGPDAVLTAMAADCVADLDADRRPRLLATLRRDQPDADALASAMGELFTEGVEVDWAAYFAGSGARRVPLPTYAFQRERHWLDIGGPTTIQSVPDIQDTPDTPTPAPRADVDLERSVRTAVAAVLGHPADTVDLHSTFRDLGLGSLTAIELRDLLATATGLALPSSLLYDHPTPAAVLSELTTRLSIGVTTARRAVVEDADIGAREPIAIIGMGCRLPGGVSTPEQLWELLAAGEDAIGPFPDDRGWDLATLFSDDPDRPGTSTTREGGFLRNADKFDAAFFGISPREATALDPQQRLLLETSWEAVERAGIVPSSLAGTATGVFVGATAQEYGPRLADPAGGFDGHLLTGVAPSVASGRIAYTLGLGGPALTVDTACSSSLVALHLAVQALRAGECTMALAGGATVMATPGMFVEFSRQRGLAPDGRCKAFGAGADGTGWAEGVGMLVLQPLSAALAAGRPVLAVIRGSAINSDGASNGLSAPSGPAQERVIRAALADARLTPSDVDVVEAHGTGTRLGDPIEAGALIAAYGRGRSSAAPLRLRSVKSVLGHTQAAAGVAGVITMVQAMRRRTLPRTLHADVPSSRVDWSDGVVELLTEDVPWPARRGRPRLAGVSSFGISGTNAHVVLEALESVAEPDSAAPAEVSPGPIMWPVSAVGQGALRAAARRLVPLAADDGPDPADVAWSLATGRAALVDRAVLFADDRAELRNVLDGLGGGRPTPGLVLGTAASGGTAFLFTGQGSQRAGMGAGLRAAEPVFAEAYAEVSAELDRLLDHPLATVLEHQDLLDRTDYAQPALFALQVALFRLVEARGLRPDALIGHSAGELAAAHVAGVLNLPDACALVAARGRLMQACRPDGAMVAVEAEEDEVLPLPEGVWLAAVNGPRAVVLSGDQPAVAAAAAHWRERGRRTRLLRVSRAFHSGHLADAAGQLRAIAEELTFRPARIPIVSTVSGQFVTGELSDPGYWADQMLAPVRFADAVRAAERSGVVRHIELGADGTLTAMAAQCADPRAVSVPLVRPDRDESRTVREALATAWCAGADVDWATALPHGRPVDLPTYPFQRSRYWLDASNGGHGSGESGHPLLDTVVSSLETGSVVCSGRLSLAAHPWLADHALEDDAVLAGAVFVDLALAAGAIAGCARVAELTLTTPMRLPRDGAVDVQVEASAADEAGRRKVVMYARPSGGDWTGHATGSIAPAADADADVSVGAWPPPGAVPLNVADAYERLAARGYRYGQAFRGLRAAWRVGDDRYAEVALPTSIGPAGHVVHPALLDATLHLLALDSDDAAGLSLPFAWSGLQPARQGATTLRVRLSPAGADTVALAAVDEAGRPVLTADGVTLRQTPRSRPGAVHVVGWHQLGTLRSTSTGAAELVEPPALDAGDPASAVRMAAHWALERVRSWLGTPGRQRDRLVVRTRGAVSTMPDEPIREPAAAAVWGLVAAAQTEHPGRFVLLDTDEGAVELDQVLASGEPQVALRTGRLLVPRLTRAALPAGTPSGWDPDGTVLITGGSGYLARLVARRLVEVHGMRHVLLASRGGGPDEPANGIRSVRCDVADRESLTALLAAIPDQHPLTAVVHAAGVLHDGVVATLDRSHLDAVLRPKTDAAWLLDELTADLDLAGFVLFSSVAGTFGTAGQGAYAAANAGLDALARDRARRGLPAVSLAWGRWAGGADGMAGGLGEIDSARLSDAGIGVVDPADALALFDAALGAGPDRPVLVVGRFDSSAPKASVVLRDPTYRVARQNGQNRPPAANRIGWAAALAGLIGAERKRIAVDLVQAAVADLLGHSSAAGIAPDRGLLELGIDSLTAIELRNRLAADTGLELPSTVVFDHPTAASLATHLLTELDRGGPEPAPATDLDLLVLRLVADSGEEATARLLREAARSLEAPSRPGRDGVADPTRLELADLPDEELFSLLDRDLHTD